MKFRNFTSENTAMDITLEYIKTLVCHHEGVDVEFKETTGQLNRGMETLCGMLNGKGGLVIFGITNKGLIIGQYVSDKTTREIGEALNKFDPIIDIQPTYLHLESGRDLIIFACNRSENNQPYFWDGKPYQRHDSVTTVMPREKVLRLHERQMGLTYDWEKEPSPDQNTTILDEQLLLNIIQGAIRRGRLSQSAINDPISSVLQRLRLSSNGNLCNAAVVLFGKDLHNYPQCMLRLARFKGVVKRDFIDNQQVEGNIFELADAAMTFFFKHLSLSGTTKGRTDRYDRLEIPYDALREAVVNSLCHRAWQQKSSSIGIAIYDDRIEIENAGRFPTSISPMRLTEDEETDNCLTSLPPNPIIANVMFLGGLIEHWGRGLSLMNHECKDAGLPVPKITDNGFFVKVVFMRPTTDDTFQTHNYPIEDQSDISKATVGHLSDNSRTTVGQQSDTCSAKLLKLIAALGEEWLSSTELRAALGFKSKSSFTRNYLKPAIANGLIAMERPDSPQSSKQRYGLTLKGKAVYYSNE